VVLREGERDAEGGLPREFVSPGEAFPVPDIDQTVIHRGEAFVVDDVIWDLERKSVTVEIVPASERATVSDEPNAEGANPDDGEENDEDVVDADSYVEEDAGPAD